MKVSLFLLAIVSSALAEIIFEDRFDKGNVLSFTFIDFLSYYTMTLISKFPFTSFRCLAKATSSYLNIDSAHLLYLLIIKFPSNCSVENALDICLILHFDFPIFF